MEKGHHRFSVEKYNSVRNGAGGEGRGGGREKEKKEGERDRPENTVHVLCFFSPVKKYSAHT